MAINEETTEVTETTEVVEETQTQVEETQTQETEQAPESEISRSILDPVDDSDEEGSGKSEPEADTFETSYDDFTLPEGMDMNKPLLEAVLPKLEGLGATQEQAQEFIDATASVVQQQDIENIRQLEAQRVAYGKEIAEHEVLGKDNFKPNQEHMHRALNQHGSEELREVLKATGIDQHPAIFGLLVSVGKNLAEDTLEGDPSTSEDKDPINAMFPTTVGL